MSRFETFKIVPRSIGQFFAALENCRPLVGIAELRREPKDVRFAKLLRRPRFCREFELLRVIEVGAFVVQHPASEVSHAGCRKVIGVVVLVGFVLDVEVPGNRRKKHGVLPAGFRVEQVQFVDVVFRVNDSLDERFGVVEVTTFAGQQPAVDQCVD